MQLEIDDLSMSYASAELWGRLGMAQRALLTKALNRWLSGAARHVCMAGEQRRKFYLLSVIIEGEAEFVFALFPNSTVCIVTLGLCSGIGTTMEQ